MKAFASLGLAFVLMLPACTSSQQAAPKIAPPTTDGYDIAACAPDLYYVVHFDTVGSDLKLTLFTKTPGEVEVLETPILFKFVKEDADGKHYISEGSKDVELVFKFQGHTAMGLQKKAGEVHAVIFGFQSDGTKLVPNSVTLHTMCEAIRKDDATPEQDAPKVQSKSNQDYVVPDSFFKPIIKI